MLKHFELFGRFHGRFSNQGVLSYNQAALLGDGMGWDKLSGTGVTITERKGEEISKGF